MRLTIQYSPTDLIEDTKCVHLIADLYKFSSTDSLESLHLLNETYFAEESDGRDEEESKIIAVVPEYNNIIERGDLLARIYAHFMAVQIPPCNRHRTY